MLASAGKEGNTLSTLDTKNMHRQTEVLYGYQQHTLCILTSMWEELGVYLLEGFLIYNATWTLLERESETKREGEKHKLVRQTPEQVRKKADRD